MAKKRKLKKKPLIILSIIMIVIIVFICGAIYIVKLTNYHKSTPYLLLKLGYSEEEKDILIEKVKDEQQMEVILKHEYHASIDDLVKQKYFIFSNLDSYLSYIDANEKSSISDVVSIVNVGADKDFYEGVTDTDLSKENLILVNKYHQLGQDFAPDDIVEVSIQYCYGTNSIRKEVYDQFKAMWRAAKEEGLSLIINSSYRDYDWQERLFQSYTNQNGEKWADSVAARPGFSEHQTGLSLDITTYNTTFNDFEETEEFKWLQKNAHKYGFILRYPKGKEYITGYDYESWHYRYLGEEMATKVKDSGLTYDEYYAYYIERSDK